MMLKKLLFGGEAGLSPIANAGVALLRIFTGVSIALAHGFGKLPPGEQFIGGVAKMGFPAPTFFAWAAGFSEFFGGILLAIGLSTRPAAFFIAVTMLVALIGVHAADPYQRQEMAFLYLFVAIAFLLMGASDWSLDSYLRRDSRALTRSAN
ncbi:MAG: DoxX family protein [Acidobacteria bacterium]|nr:DoxX family protein [Acidobacteriota bacterium]